MNLNKLASKTISLIIRIILNSSHFEWHDVERNQKSLMSKMAYPLVHRDLKTITKSTLFNR